MVSKMDTYLYLRMTIVMVLVVFFFIFIFIIIDFSENTDDFFDRGGTFKEVWFDYYLNYVPEMFRLVLPVGIFVSVLFVTGQLVERLEYISLCSSGISLYRLSIPYLFFALTWIIILSSLDAYVIPLANSNRISFEKKYLSKRTRRIGHRDIYRHLNDNRIFYGRSFEERTNTIRGVHIFSITDKAIKSIETAKYMAWNRAKSMWRMDKLKRYTFDENGQSHITTLIKADTLLPLLPSDLARLTTDIYQMSYTQAFQYINSLIITRADAVGLAQVQLYGRIFYPFAILNVVIIALAVTTIGNGIVKGKILFIVVGLIISFLYLAMIKILEPFGIKEAIDPLIAMLIPHIFFMTIGVIMFFIVRK